MAPPITNMQELTRNQRTSYFNEGLIHNYHPPRSFCKIRRGRATAPGMTAYFDENLRLHSQNDAPAFTRVMSKFTIAEWYEHGQLHRVDDYAVIRTDPAGEIISAEWWYFGKREHVVIRGVKYIADAEKY